MIVIITMVIKCQWINDVIVYSITVVEDLLLFGKPILVLIYISMTVNNSQSSVLMARELESFLQMYQLLLYQNFSLYGNTEP